MEFTLNMGATLSIRIRNEPLRKGLHEFLVRHLDRVLKEFKPEIEKSYKKWSSPLSIMGRIFNPVSKDTDVIPPSNRFYSLGYNSKTENGLAYDKNPESIGVNVGSICWVSMSIMDWLRSKVPGKRRKIWHDQFESGYYDDIGPRQKAFEAKFMARLDELWALENPESN